MSGRDQLHATLRNRAGGLRLGLRPDFVDHNHFGCVILDGFNHDGVLKVRPGHLHAAARSDPRMRDVSVTRDFIGCIDDDHALDQFRGQDPRALSQQRRLSNPGAAQQQDALPGLDHVPENVHCAVDGSTHTAGQSDNHIPSIPNAGNAMQGSLDAGAIVLRERADTMYGVFDVFTRDDLVREMDRSAREMSFRPTAEIHDNFNEILQIGLPGERVLDMWRHDTKQEIEIVCDFLAGQFSLLLVPGAICYPTIMFVELHAEQDLRSLLERSQKEPVVIFKHSTQCSRSAAAYEEMEIFWANNPEVPCGMVLVIEDRELSDTLEDRFGILHESPQAIVVFRGNPVWHASHFKITAKALEDAIATQGVQH